MFPFRRRPAQPCELGRSCASHLVVPRSEQGAPRGPIGPFAVVIGGALIVVGLLGIVLGWGSTPTAPPASSAATTSTTAPAETPQAFFSAFIAALANGDHAYLFDRLDPVVIAQFGAAECRAAVANLHPLNGERLVTIGQTGPYRYTASGHTTVVPGVTDFTVQDPSAGVIHLHFALIDGRYHYFTDCGALGG
jgi:hypothetical protein